MVNVLVMFILGILVVLVGLLILLSIWQRQIDRQKNAQKVAELKESADRGSQRAIAQYPQIKPYLCIGCGSCIEACPEDHVLGLVNGIAHVINGNRCIGHARCQEVCPVNAITVGLGDLKMRPDIPLLNPQLETTLQNVFIAGELGGMALIRHAIEQGTRAVDAVVDRLAHTPRATHPSLLDVVIVGAGPAGLAASLRAIEKKLNYLTICQDDIGGTIRQYPRRKLTLVQTVDIPLYGRLKGKEYAKEDLIAIWNELIHRHHMRVKTNVSLQSIKRIPDALEIGTSAGPFQSKTVILALGRRGTPRKLGVPGEHLEKVMYQLIDTTTYQRQNLLIVGGGDSAIEAATGLANQRGNIVTLSYRKASFTRLKARNETRIKDYISRGRIKVLFSSEVENIDLPSVTLKVPAGGQMTSLRIPNDFVFIFAGGEPPFTLLKSMGIRFGGDDYSTHPLIPQAR